MKLVEEIAKYKAEHNITILQMDRWKHVISKWNNEADRLGLPQGLIHSILQAIHKESIRKQTEVMNKPAE